MRVDQQQAPSGSKKLGHYDKFYAQGGWAYSVREERRKLKKWVVPTAGWKRGQHVLEIGCGMGLQASILRDLGLTVTAVDASAVGIEQAIARYGGKKGLEYVCADLAEWAPAGSVDGIYCRGMSWFHYELLGVNKKGVDVPAQLDRMFGWLGTGGVFVLEITTDFSGRKGGPGRVVHDNRLEDYLRLFEPLGEIISVRDWAWRDLTRGIPPGAHGIFLHCRKVV
nr:hypothetical protein [Gammaproteobacteria bacterium]